MNYTVKKLSKSLIFLALALGASTVSLSYAWGSYKFFFSAMNMILPTAGSLLGLGTALPVLITYFLIKKSIGFAMITAGFPTIFAAANWSAKNTMMRVALQLVLPVACMMLFALHPVGGQAVAYASFWFIPMILFFINRTRYSVFSLALSSTFIAHAVGSVMWLYVVPMTPEQWLALMPVVVVERFVFAGGATVFHAVAMNVMASIKNLRKSVACS